MTRSNAVTSTYGYDPVSRPTSIAHNMPGTAYDVTLTMAWNPAGQVTSRTISNGLYVYAPANGNTPYAIDGRNEIASSGSTTFSYDANRNLTNDGASSFTYDAGNRLLSAGGQAYNYTPTGELYRVGARSLAHVDGRPVSLHTTSSGAVYRRFLPGPNENETVLYYVGVDTADRRWVVEDHLGSNIGYPNASGVPTIINTFDEYGQTGPGNTTYLQFGGQFMPTVASGVVYARNRFYRPRLGRFLQTDPILYGDGLNLYAYVGNDPVNRVDPWGLQAAPGSSCFVGTPGCGTDTTDFDLGTASFRRGGFGFAYRPLPVVNSIRERGLERGGGDIVVASLEVLADPYRACEAARSTATSLVGGMGAGSSAVGTALAGANEAARLRGIATGIQMSALAQSHLMTSAPLFILGEAVQAYADYSMDGDLGAAAVGAMGRIGATAGYSALGGMMGYTVGAAATGSPHAATATGRVGLAAGAMTAQLGPARAVGNIARHHYQGGSCWR